MGPVVRQQLPPKWPRDPYALRRPAPGLTAFDSAAFGHGDRLDILRVQRVLVTHVVLYGDNKCVSIGIGNGIGAAVLVHDYSTCTKFSTRTAVL